MMWDGSSIPWAMPLLFRRSLSNSKPTMVMLTSSFQRPTSSLKARMITIRPQSKQGVWSIEWISAKMTMISSETITSVLRATKSPHLNSSVSPRKTTRLSGSWWRETLWIGTISSFMMDTPLWEFSIMSLLLIDTELRSIWSLGLKRLS